jgi:WD40 repeat protein
MSDSRYDIYISYSGRQADFAARLADGLRRNGWAVFLRGELIAGENWGVREQEACAGSRFVLVLMSAAYFSTPDLERDWRSALAREQRESRVIVLPLRLENCDVPPELAGKVWIDFRDGLESKIFDAHFAELEHALRQHSNAPALPPLTVPDDLIRSCKAGECVLFAGAGLSVRAGVADWTKFLFDLLHHAERLALIDDPYARSLEAALHEGERNSVADGIVQVFANNRKALQDYLQSYYSDPPISPAHRLLQGIPFAAVVTSNYDRLLEHTFSEYAQQGLFTTRDAEPLLDALSQKRPFILKLYGTIERLDSLIFAPVEYREALSSNISFSRFMDGIFASHTFFFTGLSIEAIQDFLSGFVFHGGNTQKHFALVAVSGSAWKARADLLRRRYNIEVIPFPISQTYPEVETFLTALRGAIPSAAERLTAVPSEPTVAPGIRRVSLENIGPFERLDLDFSRDARWKILIGDNGVGKSTILKAIAVAIMGSDAKSYAGRLVRTGQTKGRITLFTDRRPNGYVTEVLTKDVLSEAEIVSLPSRSMEAEGSLSLGFSPLRVITWSASSGPQPLVQKGRPTSDDLLPLVSGEADPRTDRLKQWIVNLDSQGKPSPVRTLGGHTGAVKSLVFSADGRSLYSGSIDKTIRIWDCWTGTELRRIDAHNSGVNTIALSGDGNVLASGSFDHLAKTWMLSGQSSILFKGSRSQILGVALDANGSTLMTASESGNVRVWSSGAELRRWRAGGPVWSLALSPDGQVVASGDYAGKVYLNQLQTGELIHSIEVKRGAIMGLAWSPDGGKLFCGSRNDTVKVLDPSSGAILMDLPGGSDTTTISVSGDGRLVASGSGTGEVRVWDAQSGAALMTAQAHSITVWSVALSPDGRTLASASEDNNIKLWNVPDSAAPGAERETIQRFFGLLGILTDRGDLRFLRVTEDFRVMVSTSDVPNGVPVELLSQGMTSLFGWVGVLCQRIKETLEVPTNEPLPTNAYALVLIDELDAHMHPAWQRVLIYRLSKAFPNVQFIATTHSPLIVADLPPESIFVLRREEGVIRWSSPTEAMDIRGLRIDQILLTDLFGMDQVRGEEMDSQFDRYRELALRNNRKPEEEKELSGLAAQLKLRNVTPEQTREANEAARLIEQSLDEKIRGRDKERLMKEVEAQMLELKAAMGKGPANSER